MTPTLSSNQNSQGNASLLKFTQGIELDKPLAPFEVAVQKAWARGLAEIEILTADEAEQLMQSLNQAQSEIADGTFHWKIEDEDIHMNLERFMCEKAGELGKKIHLGRSRNDLIATTLRLFSAATNSDLQKQITKLILTLASRAEKDINVIVPGMTHLQFGQPVRLAHVYLSFAWALKRDLQRLTSASEMALSAMPLGSAALGGTHLSVNLVGIAAELGFRQPSPNSFDSVGDRDFMLQSLQAYANVAMHLSRFAEDVIVWSSQPYSWVKLPPDWSTGSSIMPNKRNPDVPELVRAKCAQIMGAEQSALLLLKALPTSYASDLHELKRVYLQAISLLEECLSVLPDFVKGLEPASTANHLNQGHLLATEVANHLTSKGLAFREAYKEVAALIAKADAQGKQIHEMGFEINFEQAVEKRANVGGTAKSQVLKQIEELKKL